MDDNMKRSGAFRYKDYFLNIFLPILCYCGGTGIIVGIFISFYLYGANWLLQKSVWIYSLVAANPGYIPLLFAGLIALALLMRLLFKFIPEVTGSGIPQTEGLLRGIITFKWLKILLGTLIGGYISFFAGLPLGSEGPSVQMGACLAQGASELTDNKRAWRRYVYTGGASAGLAVACSAPLTGIVFALEEAHKRITPMILLSAGASVLTGTLVSAFINKHVLKTGGYMFPLENLVAPNIKYVWMLLVLGVLVGLLAAVYNLVIFRFKKPGAKKSVPLTLKLIAVFVLTGVAGLFLPQVLGGGHELVNDILNNDISWIIILIVLVVKFILILLCSNSGATGGMFIPMLALGALIGALCGKLFMLWGLPPESFNVIVVIGMTAFMGAVVRAPVTAMILVIELTGQLAGFLLTGITIFTAMFVIEILNVEPLYDKLLSIILKQNRSAAPKSIFYIDMVVKEGAFVVGKSVRDILWPARTLVLKITSLSSAKTGTDKDGEKKIKPDDFFTVQIETARLFEDIDYLIDLFGKDSLVAVKSDEALVKQNLPDRENL